LRRTPGRSLVVICCGPTPSKPKIISDGKEWNIEELKLKMKKAKELGKKMRVKNIKEDND
jgi:hypothetical protein